VFLPFATDAKGQTLSEKVAQSKCLLGDGREEEQNPDFLRKKPGFVSPLTNQEVCHPWVIEVRGL
jgi:hypothetical protein